MFLTASMVVITVAAAVSAFALIRGESKWNRLLGLNLVSAKVTLVIVLLAVATGNTFYLDIAIVYVLLSFIGVVALADYIVERKTRTITPRVLRNPTGAIPISALAVPATKQPIQGTEPDVIAAEGQNELA